jgi:hypothetical protein
LAERFGSGDGERKTSMTRQIAFEPLPASVLLALDSVSIDDCEFKGWMIRKLLIRFETATCGDDKLLQVRSNRRERGYV